MSHKLCGLNYDDDIETVWCKDRRIYNNNTHYRKHDMPIFIRKIAYKNIVETHSKKIDIMFNVKTKWIVKNGKFVILTDGTSLAIKEFIPIQYDE